MSIPRIGNINTNNTNVNPIWNTGIYQIGNHRWYDLASPPFAKKS